MGKSKSSSKTVGYLYAAYQGGLKAGVMRVGYSDNHPDTVFPSLKEQYGNDVKCSYVKTSTPEAHFEDLLSELDDNKYHESSGLVHNVKVTEVVSTLKTVTGAKTASKLVSAERDDDDEEPTKSKSKAKAGKANSKKGKKVVKEESESESESEDESEEADETEGEESADSNEESDEEVEVPVVKVKGKSKGGKNTKNAKGKGKKGGKSKSK